VLLNASSGSTTMLVYCGGKRFLVYWLYHEKLTLDRAGFWRMASLACSEAIFQKSARTLVKTKSSEQFERTFDDDQQLS
jgi:hypothetical protein